MRVIDFLQLILDLDKQTRFFYQGASDNLYAVTELVIKPESVILTTKKSKRTCTPPMGACDPASIYCQ